MLDVLSYVNEKKAAMKHEVAELKKLDHTPRMAIITDNQNFAENASYIRSKTSFALDIGVDCDVIVYEHDNPLPDLSAYSGVIVQYPFLNYSFDCFRLFVSSFIPAEKDIDGLVYDSFFKPCTPLGIVNYIDHLQQEGVLKDNIVVNVVGYGGLVGRPLAEMLMEDPNCTVCITRSSTGDWVADNFEASSDVVVCATPQPNLIKWTSKSKVYIDCGCSLINGKLIGNVSRDCYDDDALITPVPNGVGRLTVLSLFENLLEAFVKKIGGEAGC